MGQEDRGARDSGQRTRESGQEDSRAWDMGPGARIYSFFRQKLQYRDKVKC